MFNETIWHPEGHVFRAQTGGAYNLIGAYGAMAKGSAFPAKGAIPIPTGKTGTILSTGVNVRGTGTLFTREINVGDYLYQKEVVRRVTQVISDTLLVVNQAFPTDISVAEIPLLCQSQFYKAIYAKNVHASTAGLIQEAPFSSGNTYFSGGAPISYDTSGGGTIEFTLHK